jgi:hypothetical protein
MTNRKKKGRKVVLVGRLYEKDKEQKTITRNNSAEPKKTKVEMGKFLLSIPKDLRREIKFEADEKGFGNASTYICHILHKRNVVLESET